MTMFDKHGIYRRRIGQDNGIRDEKDTHRSRMDGNCLYNAEDVFTRRVEDGNVYDKDNTYLYTVDDDGHIYDADGIYQGDFGN